MVKAPMVLGHEVIGKIIHNDSSELHKGQTVAINPFKSCGHCKYYIEHNENQCTEMRFFGSAMYFPHVDGGFTHYKMVKTSQCIPYPAKADEKIMAFAEPLAVVIHAAHQAGELQGKRVFTSDAGSIGCLIVSAVKALGAAEIICADTSPHSLSLDKEMGTNMFVDPQNNDMDHWKVKKGYFDISFEVLGHPSSVNTCLEVTRVRGVVVQIRTGGTTTEFPIMTLIGKEVSFKGSLHFTSELNITVPWLANGVTNPLSLLDAEYLLTSLKEASHFVGDKTQAAKVQPVS